MLMNWHSVGVKVVAITMTALTAMSIILLLLYATNEKDKVVAKKIEAAKQLLLVSESVRNNTINK